MPPRLLPKEGTKEFKECLGALRTLSVQELNEFAQKLGFKDGGSFRGSMNKRGYRRGTQPEDKYPNRNKIWTESELAQLRELYPVAPKEKLVDLFGRPWGGIKNKASAVGISSANPRRVFQNKTYEGQAAPPDVVYLAKQLASLKKKYRDLGTQYDLLRRFLRESIEGYEPLPFYYKPTKPKKHLKPEVALSILGDFQYGSHVLKGVLGGLGEYSREVFIERLDRLRESIMEIVSIQRQSVDVSELYIVGVGDWAEREIY